MEQFTISWCLRWWSDDGASHDEAGTEIIEAPRLWEATEVIRRRVTARVEYPRRTMRLGFDGTLGTTYVADPPAGLPDRHALRARVLQDGSALGLHDELLARGATRLEVMIAFSAAFGVDLEELGDLGAAESAIARRREAWERPYRLREVRDADASILPLLHEQKAAGAGALDLFVAVRDAFGVAFGDAKQLIDRACRRDPAFDAELEMAIVRALKIERTGETYAARDADGIAWTTELRLDMSGTPFREEVVWPAASVVAIGGGGAIHLLAAGSGAVVKTLALGGDRFGHFGPADGEVLYVLGWRRVVAIDRALEVRWTSKDIAVDGITWREQQGERILLSAERDPPGGWVDVELDARTGDEIARTPT